MRQITSPDRKHILTAARERRQASAVLGRKIGQALLSASRIAGMTFAVRRRIQNRKTDKSALRQKPPI